jgi:lysozyme
MTEVGFDPEAVFAQLVDHEGDMQFVYDDATGRPIVAGSVVVGNPSVGIGRNLAGRGLTAAERKHLCMNDIAAFAEDLDRNIPWWRQLSPVRQEQMLNLVFNMGWGGLSGFKRFLAAMEAGQWRQAVAELQDSRWWGQVGRRATMVAEKILSG